MWGGILGRRVGLLMGGLLVRVWALAQTADGNQGLDEANTLVRGYYTSTTNLMFAIGAILGIVGAIRVAVMWFNGEPHMGKVAAMWFGACIFLVVVATVIKSFFGL
jgi:succinate dehydrogenase/fumarate reductase cytochrome b subunit